MAWSARRPGPWIALDCGLFRHRKLENLDARSALLWIAALLHCGDELTDGHVSTAAMRRLHVETRSSSRHTGLLVAAGLLEGDGPWNIPGYLDWNPPREHVELKRAQGAERTRQHRAKRRAQDPERNAARNALHQDAGNAFPLAQEVEREREELDLGSTPGESPGAVSDPPATVQEMASLAASAAQLLDRLRRQQ